jgi:acetyl-CoA C-acetyltransferase
MAAPDPIDIVGAARTPTGAFQGDLKELAAPRLGSSAICAAIEGASIPPDAQRDSFVNCTQKAA